MGPSLVRRLLGLQRSVNGGETPPYFGDMHQASVPTSPKTFVNADGWVVCISPPEHGMEGYVTYHTWPTGATCRLLTHEFYAIFKPCEPVAGACEKGWRPLGRNKFGKAPE